MRILVFEPLKEPYVKDIEDDIQAMQEVVGGSIEPIYFESDGKALAWCNDEFLLNGSKPNRIIGNTLVHGTFYISGNCLNEYGEWDSCSLTDEQIEKYKQQFDHIIVDRIYQQNGKQRGFSNQGICQRNNGRYVRRSRT